MANSLLRSWFWKVLRLTVVLLLIAGLLDVLMVAVRDGTAMFRFEKPANEILNSPISDFSVRAPITNPSNTTDPYDSLSSKPEMRNKPIVSETLHLDVTPEHIFARYEVKLPKDHPLFEVVQTVYGARSTERLVTDVLGPVSLNYIPLEFYPAETSVAADDSNAHFYITSQSTKPIRNDYWVTVEYPYKSKLFDLRIEKREVVIETKGAQVWSDYQATPFSKTSERTIFTRAATPNQFRVHIHFPEGTIEPAPQSERPPAPSLGTLLSKSTNPLGLGTILYGLLGALPFLLFLYWARKYGFEKKQPGFRLKVEAIQIYLAFHFATYFVFALDDLIRRWGNPASSALRKFQQKTITVFDLQWGVEHEELLLLMLLFVYVWPSMVHRWEHRGEIATAQRRRDRAGQVLLILTLIALLVWAGTWVYKLADSGFTSLTVREYYSSFVSVLLLGLMGASAWLAFEAFDRRRAGAALVMFFLLVVLLAVWTFSHLAGVKSGHEGIVTANKIIGIVVFIVTAFMLVSGFARLTYRLVSGRSVSQVWKDWSYQKRGLLVLGILLISLSTKFWPVEYWRLSSLAFELRHLFLVALVWILVDFLKYKSRDALWLQLPQSTRRAGILLALALFYSSTTRWNYIPVAFLVGFILLDQWLVPTKRFDKSLFAEIKGQLPEKIQKIIDFNDAERTLESLKKELLSKVAKGELTHKQYLQKLKAQSKVVNDLLQKDLTIKGHFAKQVVLAFGPTDSAWENGMKAALYSLLFSVPWTVLFLRNIVRAQAFGGSYLIIDVLSTIILFLLPWVSYGFIFGYFYPYIKGNNGIQKGLSLFLTIVIPSLVWNALARPLDPGTWFSFGFWVLQIFVHTMLLGLVAGDYETLRKAGFRWKHLLEIHRAGALSAWASSVLIAIGAAVSALITGGAAQLIASIVKFTAENLQSPTGR